MARHPCAGDWGLIPGSGRSRRRRKWQPTASILAWEMPRREEPEGPQSMGCIKVGLNPATTNTSISKDHSSVCVCACVCVCVYLLLPSWSLSRNLHVFLPLYLLTASRRPVRLAPASPRRSGSGSGACAGQLSPLAWVRASVCVSVCVPACGSSALSGRSRAWRGVKGGASVVRRGGAEALRSTAPPWLLLGLGTGQVPGKLGAQVSLRLGPQEVQRPLGRGGWEAAGAEDRHIRGRLDAGASDAFAVADHQIAHVYVARPSLLPEVAACVAALPGVETVLDDAGKRAAGIDHPRSGELVAVAAADSWFTWYHFLDDARAPDFARTVDIHRKPGYDPAELFFDRAIRWPKLAVASRLGRRLLGQRTLMDVIGLDATIVRGSHGRPTDRPEDGPVVISSAPELLPEGPLAAAAVKQLLLDHVFSARAKARTPRAAQALA